MRKFLYELTSCFARSGYRVTLEKDLREFAAIRSKTPDHSLVVPAFDFKKSSQINSRFLKVTDRDGNVVAISAFKYFETENIRHLLETGKIWYDNPPDFKIDVLCNVDHIKGKCFYRGGMYVFPGHRNSGIPFGLAIYSQALAIQEGLDWIVGQAFKEIVNTGIPTHTYGFETIDLQYKGSRYCPLKGPLHGTESALYFLACSRAHFMRNVREAHDILVSGRDQELSCIAAEYKRMKNPEERARLTR